ncbi:MAG TPA: hypothetical protein VH393_14095 [Ktedonobacterales bacterium]
MRIDDGGQPVTAPQLTPFRRGWYAFDLGQYRPCDGTYCLSPYEDLPPVPAPDESLAWLGPLDERTDQQMQIHRDRQVASGKLDQIAASAQRLGLTLPPSFLRLMGSPELQERIPSCTACYFSLSDDIIPCPGSEQGHIVRFLNDQQEVLLWYLYLTPAGEQRVLVSPYSLEEIAQRGPLSEEWRQAILANTFECAPTFAEFIYRFWLENVIWFKLNDQAAPLTDDEQKYVTHYERQNGAGH